ncbi:MAG TPA: septum formation initiator family protein [Patescibacteria group bacterium]
MKNLLYHPLVAVAVTIISLLFYFSLLKSDQKLVKTKESVASLTQEVALLQKEQTSLEEAVEYASTSAAQEKILRDELLMQKPGEYVLQLPAVAELESEPTPSPTPTPWESWQELIF